MRCAHTSCVLLLSNSRRAAEELLELASETWREMERKAGAQATDVETPRGADAKILGAEAEVITQLFRALLKVLNILLTADDDAFPNTLANFLGLRGDPQTTKASEKGLLSVCVDLLYNGLMQMTALKPGSSDHNSAVQLLRLVLLTVSQIF